MRKLRRLRAEKGLTMDALEERTGVSKRTISELERGMRAPQALTLAKLAAALGVDIDDLLEDEAPKAPAPPPLELEKQRGGEEERHSVYLEVFKKHMARRASAWDRQADEESSRFFVDWRTSAAYAGEVIGEAFVLTRTAVKELCPAIDQDFALEDAVREHRELVDAVKNMLKVVDKVRARGAAALERAIQGGIDHAALEEARAEKEQLAKERRAAFKLLDGRQSA